MIGIDDLCEQIHESSYDIDQIRKPIRLKRLMTSL